MCLKVGPSQRSLCRQTETHREPLQTNGWLPSTPVHYHWHPHRGRRTVQHSGDRRLCSSDTGFKLRNITDSDKSTSLANTDDVELKISDSWVSQPEVIYISLQS